MATYEIRYKTNTGRKFAFIFADDRAEAMKKFNNKVRKGSASISVDRVEKKAFNVTRSSYNNKI
ncbi:hypothetical protein CCP3SC1AL1_1560007 [Gammaproteobacteria bacterium]